MKKTILLLTLLAAMPIMAQPAPMKILIQVDQTGSMSDAHVAPPTTAEIEALADAVAIVGGDMAFCLITDRPEPFTRWHADPPPTPIEQPAVESTNPFLKAKDRAALQPKIDEYNQKMQARQRATNARIEEFLHSIARLQVAPPARASNIVAALDRASVYFAEPSRQAPTMYLLLVGDGKNTVGSQSLTASFPQSLRILVVHRSNDIGIYAQLNPRPALFESVASAVEAILKGVL